MWMNNEAEISESLDQEPILHNPNFCFYLLIILRSTCDNGLNHRIWKDLRRLGTMIVVVA